MQRTARGTEVCARNGGPILAHMSTANVARDLDLLRQAVGDRQLTYLGYSYGTAIGSYYANLFPDNVRALTLDAVIDPVEWTTGRTPAEAQQPVEYRLGSFHGAAQALTTFLSECARDTRCAFREPGVDLRAKYDRMLSPGEALAGGDRGRRRALCRDLPVRRRRDARTALQLVRRVVPGARSCRPSYTATGKPALPAPGRDRAGGARVPAGAPRRPRRRALLRARVVPRGRVHRFPEPVESAGCGRATPGAPIASPTARSGRRGSTARWPAPPGRPRTPTATWGRGTAAPRTRSC